MIAFLDEELQKHEILNILGDPVLPLFNRKTTASPYRQQNPNQSSLMSPHRTSSSGPQNLTSPSHFNQNSKLTSSPLRSSLPASFQSSPTNQSLVLTNNTTSNTTSGNINPNLNGTHLNRIPSSLPPVPPSFVNSINSPKPSRFIPSHNATFSPNSSRTQVSVSSFGNIAGNNYHDK
jgi:hypothetical protein